MGAGLGWDFLCPGAANQPDRKCSGGTGSGRSDMSHEGRGTLLSSKEREAGCLLTSFLF